MDKELVSIKIQSIKNDLVLLREKHIYEIEYVRGTPSCSTLANRIQENVDFVVKAYKELLNKKS